MPPTRTRGSHPSWGGRRLGGAGRSGRSALPRGCVRGRENRSSDRWRGKRHGNPGSGTRAAGAAGLRCRGRRPRATADARRASARLDRATRHRRRPRAPAPGATKASKPGVRLGARGCTEIAGHDKTLPETAVAGTRAGDAARHDSRRSGAAAPHRNIPCRCSRSPYGAR